MTSLSTPTSSPTPVLDTESAARLRMVIGRLSRRLRTTPAGIAAGLSPTRSSLLLAIDRRGPIRLSVLGESEGLNPTMMSRSVTQLVDAGLVTRTSDEGDRRAAWVCATDDGHGVAERMRRERTDAINTALGGLDEAQRRIIEQAIPALEILSDHLAEVRP
jgi:DNA-binding MarR family transcriptional regulator